VSRYTAKRRLLRPLTAIRRRQRAGRLSPYALAVYEAHDYRPSMRRFFLATRENPDILVDVDLGQGSQVLDVGAYVGEWSERILDRADARGVPDIRIHAFEPEPSSVRTLRGSLRGDPRVVVHPFGLAGRDRTESLAVGGPGSSVFVDPGSPGFLGARDVELRDVDAVLSSLGIEQIDFVKINIEGGEFELLDRLHETGWLRRMGTVLIQFHEFGPDAYRGRRRNRRQLSETHRCVWNYPWVYERWDPK